MPCGWLAISSIRAASAGRESRHARAWARAGVSGLTYWGSAANGLPERMMTARARATRALVLFARATVAIRDIAVATPATATRAEPQGCRLAGLHRGVRRSRGRGHGRENDSGEHDQGKTQGAHVWARDVRHEGTVSHVNQPSAPQRAG